MSGHLQHFCGSHLGAAWAACHGRGWQWGTTGGRKLTWAAGGGPRQGEAASSLKGPAGALGVFLYSDSLGRWAVWFASSQQFGSFAQGSQREAEVYVTESGDDGKVANSERISPSAPQHRLAQEGSSWNPHILDIPSLPRGGPIKVVATLRCS